MLWTSDIHVSDDYTIVQYKILNGLEARHRRRFETARNIRDVLKRWNCDFMLVPLLRGMRPPTRFFFYKVKEKSLIIEHVCGDPDLRVEIAEWTCSVIPEINAHRTHRYWQTGVLRLKFLVRSSYLSFLRASLLDCLCMLFFVCNRIPVVRSVILRVSRFCGSSARQVTLWSYPFITQFFMP